MLGNVHAIAFACANPELQNRLQNGLKAALDSLIYVRGAPNPEHQRLNKLTMKHTLRRRRACVAGDPDDEGVDAGESYDFFLQMWNGDWASPAPQHICNGCCESEQNCWQKMFSSAIGIDMLQSHEVNIPCADDWGTFGVAMGKSAFGILCHNVLADVFNKALPDFATMLPNDVPDGDDDLNSLPARKKVQKKAWRSKCVLNSPEHTERIVLMCWIGAPIEWLIAELQHLDNEASKGLLDVVVDSPLNPFTKCRMQLAKLVSDGAKGDLESIFAQIPHSMHREVLQRVRELGMDMASQVFFRFHAYNDFPYAWARLVHPRISEDWLVGWASQVVAASCPSSQYLAVPML